MPQGKGQVKYAVVAVDYFTKWVEAEPLATITAAKMEDFVWTHICCRFGIPYAIITDNGRQFDSELFRQFCTRLKINLFFASPAHPQSNGQVEAMNKIVKKLLKRQLDKAKGAWPEFGRLTERPLVKPLFPWLSVRKLWAPSNCHGELNSLPKDLRKRTWGTTVNTGNKRPMTAKHVDRIDINLNNPSACALPKPNIFIFLHQDMCHAHNPLLQSHIGNMSIVHASQGLYKKTPILKRKEEKPTAAYLGRFFYCSSGIPQLSQTHRLSGLPFYLQSFSRFPQGTYDVVPSSFQPASFSQSCHLSYCISLSLDDVFTWDDVVRISEPVQISGATRKRSKSAITLSLESQAEFLPFVIEDHSQRKIQTLMAVSFIAEHRTRAVGDVIKSLGEEHSLAVPVPRHGGSVKGLDNEVLEADLDYINHWKYGSLKATRQFVKVQRRALFEQQVSSFCFWSKDQNLV
ncbi:hypothetical protein L3X38_016426 [Prunus dulcis]|uniref:Integrase catalytic domain-containing protein n=1 Tax=Prunus dulcis TaxID=3755 RepID=A0AAD4W7Y7_PRUDU|nr:hypothetical protein L3X38_016426 [Prunus dulcis]